MENGGVLVPKKTKTEEDKLIEFIGETICMESALLASSINLMRAGNIAKQAEDSDSLIRVANAWYDIAKFLSGALEENDEEKRPHFGFAALETLDEPGDEPHEGESGIEICSKSW